MSLAAPYIWIMTSGVYDVLQVWDKDGTVSYFDIYVNGMKVRSLIKDDDISYITIEDLGLDGSLSGYNINVIGYDPNENYTEESNYVCWYENGNYNNDGADPDIIMPFQETTSTIYFYLDSELVDTITGENIFNFSSSNSSALDVSAHVKNPPRNVVVMIGSLRPYTYTYDVPLSSVSISPTSIAKDATDYTLHVYATSRNNPHTFKRFCNNNFTIDDSTIICHHYGKMGHSDCITFMSDTDDFTLTAQYVEWDGTVEYSVDREIWTTWDGSAITSARQKLYLRGYNNTTFYTTNGAQFQLSGPAGCYGNINTLLQYNEPPTILADSCYRSMFCYCPNLTQAPELPATTLADSCYRSMFYDCTNLTQAPELPATTLASYCYQNMFYGCTSLTQAPELPATTLADSCYRNMLYGCTSLTQAPELPATTLANYCYYAMFRNCTSLTQAPELPATTLADSCYRNMLYSCTSLTQAPELPATILADYCYQYMFYGCTSLTQAPELPATTLAEYCYYAMLYGCTSLTQAPELPATTLANYCYCAMFDMCANLTQAPELPATTLASYCYRNMFYGCTSLVTAPSLPATTLAIYCYYCMFYDCISLVTVPSLPAQDLRKKYCYSNMFQGCTKIKLSNTQTDEYNQAYRIPTTLQGLTGSGNYPTQNMFKSTGGTYTGSPTVNVTYYLHSSNTIV